MLVYEHYLGIFCGILARTFVPYLVELKNNPKLKWNNRYLVSAGAGIILSLILAIVIAQYYEPMGFGVAFAAAFTLQSLSRTTQKLFGN